MGDFNGNVPAAKLPKIAKNQTFKHYVWMNSGDDRGKAQEAVLFFFLVHFFFFQLKIRIKQ
jgi:hypothetical protein